MAKLNMIALGRVVLARREHVIALEPMGRGLVGTALRYPYEVRDEKPYFEDIPDLKLFEGDARPGCPFRADKVWSLRPFAVRRSLRKRAHRSVEEKT